MRLLAVALLLAAAPARADGEADRQIAPTALTIQVVGPSAKLVARYPVAVGATTFDRSAVVLELPVNALATGATVIEGSTRHRLSLAGSDQISATLEALALRAPGTRRAEAVAIVSADRGAVTLAVATPQARSLAIDLELAETACFADDTRYVAIPADWVPVVAHTYKAIAGPESIAIAELCHETADTAWVALPTREVSARPSGDARVGITASRLSVSQGDLAHLEIDLARELADVPRDLATVILVDGSRSLDTAETETQRAIIESYLQHVPGTLVQVLAYARKPRPLLPSWTSASVAAPRIDRELHALAGRNGSNIDSALEAAGAWLARTNGTRRILLFSDGRLARRLTEIDPTKLKRLLPPNTMVHVISVSAQSGELGRNDTFVLAPLATATDGIAVIGRSQDGTADATMLARPVSFDEIKLSAPGWTAVDELESSCLFDMGSSLDQGRSCEWWGVGEPTAGPLTIEGLVWGRRVVRTIQPDPTRGRELARALVGAHRLADEALQHDVELAAYAVDAAWSLFGMWNGSGGYNDLSAQDELGSAMGARFSSIGGGSNDFLSTGVGSMVSIDLHDQIRGAIASCHPGARTITGHLELTREEIVEVEVQLGGDNRSKASRELHTCVEDALWNMMVTMPNAPDWSDTRVAFGPDSR